MSPACPLPLALSAVLAVLAPGCGGRVAGAVEGSPAPSFAGIEWSESFPIGKEPSTFGDPPLARQVVLIEFFATW